MRTKLAAAVVLTILATPAAADWHERHGGAYNAPSETNANVEGVMVVCVDGPVLNLYTLDGGQVEPKGGNATNDYFMKPGFINANIDDRDFPLVAAGSDDAVVLFSEGSLAENYLAPLHPDFVSALVNGKKLTLSFDLTVDNAADGSAFESFATFSLGGAASAVLKTVEACR